MRDFTKLTPAPDLRSAAMEDLCRVRKSLVGGGSLLDDDECVKFGIARSMRRTEAPLSARRSPAKGPEGCVSEA
jgi:hypothetical protein